MTDPVGLVAGYLATINEITALVGTRIYEEEAEAGVREDNIVVYDLGGDELHESGMGRPIVQISAYAKTRADALVIRSLVIDTMDVRWSHSGLWVVSTYASSRVTRVHGWWNASADFNLRYLGG